MTLNHRVVAMVRGTVKRVLCLTCNKQHNYRAPKEGEGPEPSAPAERASAGSKSSKKAGSVPKATNATREWQANVANKDSTEFVPYSIHETFEVGQLVSHPKFGSGYVKETMTAQKLCILFKDGPRTLIHGRP